MTPSRDQKERYSRIDPFLHGKAALVTMAFEPRFAMVLVGSSGEGGAKLHRRNFGEAVESLTGSGAYQVHPGSDGVHG